MDDVWVVFVYVFVSLVFLSEEVVVRFEEVGVDVLVEEVFCVFEWYFDVFFGVIIFGEIGLLSFVEGLFIVVCFGILSFDVDMVG